jgi:hypothetical protein
MEKKKTFLKSREGKIIKRETTSKPKSPPEDDDNDNWHRNEPPLTDQQIENFKKLSSL